MRSHVSLWALVLAVAACRGEPSCEGLDAERDPQRVVRVCSARFERTREARAAVAVVDAHTARKDDAAIVAWANRVGPVAGTAKVWRRAAQAHARRGEGELGIAAARRSMQLWEQAGEPGEAAYDAHLLKEAYFAKAQLLPALEVVRRERELALASTDEVMRWGSFTDLFGILDEIGDYAGAKALLRDMQQRTAPSEVRSQQALRFCEGLMHFREGRLELARLAYRDALKMTDASVPDETLRSDFYNLVEIEVLLGDVEAAAAHLASAVATLPPSPPPYALEARAFFTGLVARARRDPAGAEAAVRGALAAGPSPFWAWQLEELLGKALEDQGRTEEALAAYHRAIAVIEAMRKDLAVDVLQVALRDRKRAPYEAVFALEAGRGDRSAAMAAAQAMWQRGFIEAFDVGSEPGEAASSSADPSLERLRGLSTLVPQLVASAAGAPASGAEGGGEGGADDVLAFIEARGALWRYSRAGGAAKLERLALSVAEARRLVGELRARPGELAASARLAEALLPASVVAAPARARPLAIIADGALAGLPFAALRLRDRWLVQDRVLRYWPALPASASSRPVAPAAASSSSSSSSAAPARSDPSSFALLAPATTGGGAVDLTAARSEVIDLALVLGAAPLLGEAATIAALRKSAGAQLLHLAAHGGLAPGGAFVRLADGDVTATDIVTWKLAPRVVVLASCASGVRPTGSMWGALGGAFLAAGSEAVIATLWSVEDAATSSLVYGFYAAGGERDPAGALAAAQRKAIAAGIAPQHWAAFVALAAAR